MAQQSMPAIAEQGFTWADTQHLLAIFIMTAILSPGQDNHAVNQLRQARHTDRYLALEWEGCQHSKHLGEAWDLLDILWKVQGPHPPKSIPETGKVGLPIPCVPRLLSFLATGRGPSTRAPNRGTFILPSPCAGSWALFSFHPVLLGFNGQKLCPPAPL